MSIRKNAVANFAGQAYTALMGIVMLPFYLEYLGAEAYGLVGFFVLLHSWLALLTAGLMPTLSRQVAFYRGRGELGGRAFGDLLRSLEIVVLVIGIVTALSVAGGSGWLAAQWLTVKVISLADVSYCILLMGVMVGLRWLVALYSSGINGMEKQVWLNGYGAVFATLRYGAAYVLLRWISHEVVHFFEFQLVMSIPELLVISGKFYRSLPSGPRAPGAGAKFSWPALRAVSPFALGIAYTTTLWVGMTQSDKLILSHVLSLAEYGYFAIVIVIANAILRFSEPINQAVLPRLTRLHAQGDAAAMLELYRSTTQYLAVIGFSVAGVLALFPEAVIYALTGNLAAAKWGAPALSWYVLGNAILAVGGMQYTLQFVHGKLRMHVINTTINAMVQVPILAFAAFNYGAVAAAAAWFAIRITAFLVWPAVVHHRFAPGLHLRWLRDDVLCPFLAAAAVMTAATAFFSLHPQWLAERWRIFPCLMMVGGLSLVAGGAAAGRLRENFKSACRRMRRSSPGRIFG